MELPATHIKIFHSHYNGYLDAIVTKRSTLRKFLKSIIKFYITCISYLLYIHSNYIPIPFNALRLCQYGSKLVWYILEQQHKSQTLIMKIKNLETSVSMARKLLRLGKSLDSFRAALNSIHLSDVILRLTITLSKINQAIYLLFDNAIWAGKVGLANVDITKLGQISSKFWFFSLILNLSRDFYELRLALLNEVNLQHKKKYDDSSSRQWITTLTITQLVKENRALVVDTLKNICDIWLPLNSLGLITFSPGIIGLLGLISSILTTISIFYPNLKLKPS